MQDRSIIDQINEIKKISNSSKEVIELRTKKKELRQEISQYRKKNNDKVLSILSSLPGEFTLPVMILVVDDLLVQTEKTLNELYQNETNKKLCQQPFKDIKELIEKAIKKDLKVFLEKEFIDKQKKLESLSEINLNNFLDESAKKVIDALSQRDHITLSEKSVEKIIVYLKHCIFLLWQKNIYEVADELQMMNSISAGWKMRSKSAYDIIAPMYSLQLAAKALDLTNLAGEKEKDLWLELGLYLQGQHQRVFDKIINQDPSSLMSDTIVKDKNGYYPRIDFEDNLLFSAKSITKYDIVLHHLELAKVILQKIGMDIIKVKHVNEENNSVIAVKEEGDKRDRKENEIGLFTGLLIKKDSSQNNVINIDFNNRDKLDNISLEEIEFDKMDLFVDKKIIRILSQLPDKKICQLMEMVRKEQAKRSNHALVEGQEVQSFLAKIKSEDSIFLKISHLKYCLLSYTLSTMQQLLLTNSVDDLLTELTNYKNKFTFTLTINLLTLFQPRHANIAELIIKEVSKEPCISEKILILINYCLTNKGVMESQDLIQRIQRLLVAAYEFLRYGGVESKLRISDEFDNKPLFEVDPLLNQEIENNENLFSPSFLGFSNQSSKLLANMKTDQLNQLGYLLLTDIKKRYHEQPVMVSAHSLKLFFNRYTNCSDDIKIKALYFGLNFYQLTSGREMQLQCVLDALHTELSKYCDQKTPNPFTSFSVRHLQLGRELMKNIKEEQSARKMILLLVKNYLYAEGMMESKNLKIIIKEALIQSFDLLKIDLPEMGNEKYRVNL